MDSLPQIDVPTTAVVPAPRPPEREVYRKAWSHPEYRAVAPGEQCAQVFLAQARPKRGASVLDIGCGTGRGGFLLALLGGLNVTYLDFADNCLDEDIVPMLTTQAHALRFIEADITHEFPVVSEYGFCTDVMEHIQPELVDTVIDNCLAACQHVFFQISTVDDVMGGLVGHPLHLTVQSFSWWLRKFNERNCTVHWSMDANNCCLFYVTAWWDGPKTVDAGILNIEQIQVRKNVEHNVQQGWMQASPHATNDFETMILGGGPSMLENIDKIRELREQGVKLICLNGAYNWCLENDLKPSALIMVDAREFNARFTRTVIPDCKYLIASQCDPKVFEGLPKDRTYMWHTTTEAIRDILSKHLPVWYGIPGGSTVLLRAVPLLRTLGYKRYHLFGCDSCLAGDKHHAYAQNENDSAMVFPVIAGGRTFQCHTWMAAQAQEFMDLIRFLGNEIEFEVYGDGLLAHILNTGAKMYDEQMELQGEQRDTAALQDITH